MIVLEFDPIWVLIFFTTLALSILCLGFGTTLIRRNPHRTSTRCLGGFFLGQFLLFFTFPYIVLDPVIALWAYKIQVLGFELSTISTVLFGRSLTSKISLQFFGIALIPAVVISLIAWIITPFNPIVVPYGYELDIALWFVTLLAAYGFPPLIYLILELERVFKTSERALRHRAILLIVSYLGLVISMSLFFWVLPLMLSSPEIKPIGIMISTVCVLGIYYGYRKRNKNNTKS
ncbi:MAG: hypothetical protein ACTSQ8_17865 [Candidatus Helarchaeota archaeon]